MWVFLKIFLEFVKGDLDFISGLSDIPKDEVLSQTGELNRKYQNRFKWKSFVYAFKVNFNRKRQRS